MNKPYCVFFRNHFALAYILYYFSGKIIIWIKNIKKLYDLYSYHYAFLISVMFMFSYSTPKTNRILLKAQSSEGLRRKRTHYCSHSPFLTLALRQRAVYLGKFPLSPNISPICRFIQEAILIKRRGKGNMICLCYLTYHYNSKTATIH